MHQFQKDYIQSFIDSFEYALNGSAFADTSIGYLKYADVNSFIDFYIVNELSRNIDAYRLSTFLYKDRNSNGGKLVIGPLWDFNLAYGNASYCDGWDTNGWEQDASCSDVGNNPFWFSRLLADTTYQNKLKCRWDYLRQTTLSKDSIFNFIDSMAYYLDDAQERNFQKWDVLGSYVWPNYYIGNTYQEEIDNLKTWIESRLIWIDNNIPGNCYQLPSVLNTLNVSDDKKIVDVVDVLGRVTNKQKNRILFYIFNDGTVEKKIIID